MFDKIKKNLSYRRRRRETAARQKAVPRSEPSLSVDMASDSRTLLLAFGGMEGRMGIPPFEFLRLSGEIPIKRLFVRDLRQAWYHRGMPGHGDTLLQAADSLRRLVDQHDVERIVCAGNSAGGYAAMAFGTLLEADEVLCFSPQTILDMEILDQMGDRRWNFRLRPLVEAGALDADWIDLASAVRRERRSETVYRVFFDDSLRVDRLHATRLNGIEGLRMYRFGRGGHELVRELRDAGALGSVLRRSLGVPGEA